MTPKEIAFAGSARRKMIAGANILADAIAVTLGPRGRNVLIDKSFGAPISTKDGVSVAKSIELSDPIANIGVRLLREVAKKPQRLPATVRRPPPCWRARSCTREISRSPPD